MIQENLIMFWSFYFAISSDILEVRAHVQLFSAYQSINLILFANQENYLPFFLQPFESMSANGGYINIYIYYLKPKSRLNVICF